MQYIRKHARPDRNEPNGTGQNSASGSPCSQERTHRDIIKGLLARFQISWGDKWTDHVQSCGGLELVTTDWADGLTGIPLDAMRDALDEARRTRAWPPSISEFRELAIGAQDHVSKLQRGPAYQLRNEGLALPGPKDQTSRKNAMRRLKEILPNINVSTENQNA